MNFSNIFKRQAIIISLAVVFVGLIILGVSYALFVVEKSGSTNSISLGSLSAVFNKGTNITGDLVPMTDLEALETSDTLYSFSIENNGSLGMDYTMILDDLGTDDTYLEHKYIKIKINDNNPVYLTELPLVSGSGIGSEYIILEDILKANTNLSNQSIRLWVSSYDVDGNKTPLSVLNKKVNFQFKLSGLVGELKPYKEEILAGSDPVLDSKMIPVVISDTGIVSVADTTAEWYNYTNSEWANAVILNTHRSTTPGEVLDMDDIAQMYVWIPRYEYSKSSIESAAHAIDVTFVNVNTTTTTAEMESEDIIVHPAFCWGNECQEDRSHADNIELPGIWVGKFENGWQDDFVDDEDNDDVDTTYIIKPNINSVHSSNVSTTFYNIQRTSATYSLDATTDVHMMKNTEWGVIAYLSQSKYGICNTDGTCTNSEGTNIKIENNNYYNSTTYDIVTGCGGNDTHQAVSLTGIAICPDTNRWETVNGIKASTTHNTTGVYDMAGGRWEEVMGIVKESSGSFYINLFTDLESKYFDVYENGSWYVDYTRGIWGDATKELDPVLDPTAYLNVMENWNSDLAYFPVTSKSCFMRGGRFQNESDAGVWNFNRSEGFWPSVISARAVLIIE